MEIKYFFKEKSVAQILFLHNTFKLFKVYYIFTHAFLYILNTYI